MPAEHAGLRAFGDNRLNSYALASGATILFYDTALNFAREVELVWEAKWSVGKVLYVANRYAAIIAMINELLYGFLTDQSIETCRAYYLLSCFLPFIIYAPAEAVLGLRTYALYHGSAKVRKFIIVFLIVQLSVSLGGILYFMMSASFTQEPPAGVTCTFYITTIPRAAAYITTGCAIVYDWTLWVITAYRVYQLWHEGGSRLVWVFFRDGPVFITLVSLNNLSQLFLWIFMPAEHAGLRAFMAVFSEALITVLTSRLLLNLREYINADFDVNLTSVALTPSAHSRARNWRDGVTQEICFADPYDGRNPGASQWTRKGPGEEARGGDWELRDMKAQQEPHLRTSS